MTQEAITNAERKIPGLRLRLFNILIIILTLALTSVLFYVERQSQIAYDDLRSATEEYIVCRQSADDVQDASDYLTRKVWEFAVTGEAIHVENYFREALVTQRREHATETISRYLNAADRSSYLKQAVDCSNELMEYEYYAMRLAIEGYHLDLSSFPDVLAQVVLTPEDAALSDEAKRELAREMLFSDTYNAYKEQIEAGFNEYVTKLLDDTRRMEEDGFNRFSRLEQVQRLLVLTLVILLLAILIFTSFLIIIPLKRNAALVMTQKKMPVSGAQEMRVLATYYNRALDENMLHQEHLSYEATHDSLTGVRNRGFFDELYRSRFESSGMALLLVDVDEFKSINDAYGHTVGDKVLKLVAEQLRAAFRAEDKVCRIGGDEFAVILFDVTPECEQQLRKKIDDISEALRQSGSEKMPAPTLSVGCAFGDGALSFKSLYKNTDRALYQIKNAGRNGIGFYQEQMQPAEHL